VKAWSYECTHPFRDEWFANLDQTRIGDGGLPAAPTWPARRAGSASA
jgi:hypothetical protein